jgi:FAD/FMN-containing dehydrogenase
MDTELAALVKTVGPADGEEWEERCTRWNQFTEIENKVRIVAVPKSVDDVVAIAKWAAKYKQSNISVRAGGHGFFSAAEVVVDMVSCWR